MAASDIPLARAALALLRAGRAPSPDQRAALARVEATVDARKPLSAYAPRTQRRYLAAAKVGTTAHTANRVEYDDKLARARGGGVASRRARVYRLAQELDAHELEGAGGVFDQDQIDYLIELMGLTGALFILTQQLDSVHHFQEGDSAPGRRRFFGRATVISRYRKGMGYDEYTTPYFWYRAMK